MLKLIQKKLLDKIVSQIFVEPPAPSPRLRGDWFALGGMCLCPGNPPSSGACGPVLAHLC